MSTDTLHPRIAEVLDALAAAQRLMQDTLEQVPVALRDAPPLPDSWSSAQLSIDAACAGQAVARERVMAAYRKASGRARATP